MAAVKSSTTGLYEKESPGDKNGLAAHSERASTAVEHVEDPGSQAFGKHVSSFHLLPAMPNVPLKRTDLFPALTDQRQAPKPSPWHPARDPHGQRRGVRKTEEP